MKLILMSKKDEKKMEKLNQEEGVDWLNLI